MNAVKRLFSFKGEIGRGQLWLVCIGISLIGSVVEIAAIQLGLSAGDPAFLRANFIGWPSTQIGWGAFAIYWLANLMCAWIFVAALARRLNDLGIRLKWLFIFGVFSVLSSLTVPHFVHNGDVRISPIGWVALIFTGLPACGMGLWIFGSAFIAAGYKSQRIDPAQLPEGWKN